MSRRERLKCITDFEENNQYSLETLSLFNIEYVMQLIKSDNENAYVITDEDGNIINSNDKWCKICDYNYDDLFDKNANILSGEQTNKTKIKKFMEELKTNGNSVMEIINYTQNRKSMDCIVMAYQLHQLNQIFYLSKKKYFLCQFILK